MQPIQPFYRRAAFGITLASCIRRLYAAIRSFPAAAEAEVLAPSGRAWGITEDGPFRSPAAGVPGVYFETEHQRPRLPRPIQPSTLHEPAIVGAHK